MIALLTFAACSSLFDCVQAWTDPNAALQVAKDRLIKKTARDINAVREGTSEAQRTGLKALGYAMLQEHDFNKDVEGYKYGNPIGIAFLMAINWFLLKRFLGLGKSDSQS